MTTTQTTGFETFTSDYTGRINIARRADGQWFTRIQSKDPRYGYRWGSWRETSSHDAYSEDVQRLRPVTWRLPK